MTAETITPKDDAITSCDHQKQLDHIDEMCHRILTVIEELEPHLPRLMSWLDPGAAMRRAFGKGKRAIQEPASAPVHVGEASEDRPPLGA